MTPTIHQLQEEIVETMAIEKAYNLPQVCKTLGLEEGDEQEAFGSKRVYVRRRIVGYTKKELLGLAHEVMKRYPSESLQNIVNSFEIGLGVDGNVKNLIFAANGPKPKIVLSDSINNDILVVENSEYCLVYDLPFPDNGLTWEHLVEWWADANNLPFPCYDTEVNLYNRLLGSLESPPEILLFKAYFKRLRKEFGEGFPAIIPQVYLYYV